MRTKLKTTDWTNYAKKLWQTKKALVIGAAIVIVAIAIFIATTTAGRVKSSVQAFRIGTEGNLPKQGTIEKDATIEEGKAIQIQARYDHKKLEQARVKFFGSDNKEAFDTGLFQLSDQGTFSVSIGKKTLKVGEYTMKLLDQKDKTLLSGSLKIVKNK